MSKFFQFERRAESHRDSEDGFILLAVLFLVVLILIGLAVAAPKMARSIQRDRELELVHRGEQYKRAIKLYYAKFGAYPTSIDQLLNTNDVKFLRKRYKDPITGKDDWRIIHFGEAKVPPMGLFGQPLGPTGQPGAGTGAATASNPATSSAFGNTPASTSYNFTPPPNPFGSTPNAGGSEPPDAGGDAGSVTTPGESSNAESTDESAGATGQAATTNAPGSTATPFGTSSTGATGGTNITTGAPSSAFGASLGSGGPIVGVGIPSDKASLIEYKKQKQYNKWEFVYNPIEDQLTAGGLSSGAAGGANPAGTGTGTTGTGTGSNIGTGSPFGSSTNSGVGSAPNSGSSNTGIGSTPMGSNPQQQ
jgi:type II secretory pathway pseudopilin PulG